MEINNCSLIYGDCLDVMIKLHKVDLVLADIPYGTTRCKWDSVINLDDMWGSLNAVTSKKTPIILFAQTPFDKILGASNIQHLKYEWIWEKTSATGHLNAKKMPMKAHENILVFYENLPTYNPQKTFGHKLKSAIKRVENGDRLQSEVYGKQKRTTKYSSTERYPRSIQTFKSDKQKSKLHPTQKPVGLMEYLIRTYSSEGDTVLDFCMGSGTTGIACINTNRKFIGIEKNKNIFDGAAARISNHSLCNGTAK